MKKIIEIIKNENIARLVELPPKIRVMNTNRSCKKISLPYLYFFVRAEIDKYELNNQYLYSGQPKLSALLFASINPIKNIDDEVSTYASEEIICTPHEYDNSYWQSMDTLVDFVVNFWLSANFDIVPNKLLFESYKTKNQLLNLYPQDKDKINNVLNCSLDDDLSCDSNYYDIKKNLISLFCENNYLLNNNLYLKDKIKLSDFLKKLYFWKKFF